MSDPLERVTNLLALLLETCVPLTITQISDRLAGHYPAKDAARRQTFERDKSLLRSEGVPIEQTVLGGDQAGQTGYWIDRDRYELGELGLEDDERAALQLAVATVQLGTEWGAQALWKLGGSGLSTRRELEASLPSLPVLPELAAALGERRVVRFGYRGSDRTLEPYSLLARHGWWYLIGLDRDRDELRTYRVDRMDGWVETTDDTFERPSDFDPREFLPADAKRQGEGEEYALVRVAAERCAHVESDLGAAAIVERDPDGSTVFRVPCTNPLSFRHWLIELLEHAEVIGPEPVRLDFVRWLEALV